MEEKNERFQILSLSGGGIRGLYTVTVLADIEEMLAEGDENYSIARHFDMLAGTSIGGIISIGLASGLTARRMKELLYENRLKIFPNRPWYKLPGVKLLHMAFGALYNSNTLIKILEDEIGDKRIRESICYLCIPAVNGTNGQAKVYKTPHHPEKTWDGKKRLIDAAVATSSAPTYFKPHLEDDNLMLDGGLVANSPSFIAYHEATSFIGIPKENVHMLALGTLGSESNLLTKSRGWGYVSGFGGGKKLIDLILSSTEKLHNDITKQLLGDVQFQFVSPLNANDQAKVITLDNASDQAASMLKGRGNQSAQNIWGNIVQRDFFGHEASEVNFY